MLEFAPNALNSLLYVEESVAIGVGIISRYIEKLPVAEQSSLLWPLGKRRFPIQPSGTTALRPFLMAISVTASLKLDDRMCTLAWLLADFIGLTLRGVEGPDPFQTHQSISGCRRHISYGRLSPSGEVL